MLRARRRLNAGREEQDFMFQQGLINKFECFGADITAQFYAFKLCTNSTRYGFYL